jgi:hypothetical protein
MSQDYILPNGTNAADVCMPCKAGLHDECEEFWHAENVLEDCCCMGLYDAGKHYATLLGYLESDESAPRKGAAPESVPRDLGSGTETTLPDGKPRGDSGYVHWSAWPSSKAIGSLKEPLSTGRKRVAVMYPIPKGKTCEWAGLAAAGGGVNPIVGCIGYPATDLHHGPDKNTLNNMRVNVHQICSFCHNAWHGANDSTYPKRDYVEDQAKPWLPEGELRDHDAETLADQETLYAVDAERRKDADRRTGGRKDWTDDGPEHGDLDADDE